LRVRRVKTPFTGMLTGLFTELFIPYLHISRRRLALQGSLSP
jgi:hypothetical protein